MECFYILAINGGCGIWRKILTENLRKQLYYFGDGPQKKTAKIKHFSTLDWLRTNTFKIYIGFTYGTLSKSKLVYLGDTFKIKNGF